MMSIIILLTVIVLFYMYMRHRAITSLHSQDPDEEDNCAQNTITQNKNQEHVAESKVECLKYFCIKDKGYHVSVWPKDQLIGDYIKFPISGMKYRDNIDNYLGEYVGTLEPEPTNPYDKNAIRILAPDGHHVGYVPKDQTQYIRDFKTLPCQCFFYIGNNDGTYFSCCYLTNKNP